MALSPLAARKGDIRGASARRYLVVNCGYCLVEIRDRVARIHLRPGTLRSEALVNLSYLFSDYLPENILAQWQTEQGNETEILPSCHRTALASLVTRGSVADRAGSRQRRIERLPIQLDELPNGGTLRLAAAALGSQATYMSREHVRDVLNVCVGGSYVFIDIGAFDGRFLLSAVGPGVPACAQAWLNTAIGADISGIPDASYAEYCRATYAGVLAGRGPLIERIDALVKWPGYPEQRRRYLRLVSVVTTETGDRWLASVSAPLPATG